MRQPTLFEENKDHQSFNDEALILYALGDFQSRGKELVERDLPLDRLRGALKRAVAAYGRTEELSDERAVAAFGALGAETRRVPSFVAKHPFRVKVPIELAERARLFYSEISAQSR